MTGTPLAGLSPGAALSGQRSAAWYARAAGIACLVAVIWLVAALAAGPVLLGKQSFVVAGGSMAPAIPEGAAVIVDAVAAGDVRMGDVLVYVTQRGDIVTHRVMLVLDGPEGRHFITKGDANTAVDAEPLHGVNVLGRVWYAVPFAGHLLGWADRPEARIAGAVGILLLGMVWLRQRQTVTGPR